MDKQLNQYNKDRTKEIQIIWIGLLLLAALLVRWSFFSGGIRGSDAFAYAQYAHDIVSGRYDLGLINDFYGFRYSVLLPTSLSFICFGVNDFASSFFSFMASVLNVFIVFTISHKIFNRDVAILSAILLIFYPLDIMSASVLGPDSFIPILSSSAIVFYIMAEEKLSDTSRRAMLLILSGLFIALAYMARITSIFLYAALILYQIYKKKFIPVIWTTIGFCIPLAVEALYFYLYTGDPFFEVHRITSSSISHMVKNDYDLTLLFYPKSMFGFDITGLAMFGLIWWFVAGGLLFSWQKKDSRMLFISLCLVIPFLGFEFGFQSFKEGILIAKNYNYLSLITGPAMVIGAYFLYHLYHTLHVDYRIKSFILFSAILIIIPMNLYGTYRLYLNVKDDAAPYIAVANYLKKKPYSIIYTHHFRWPLFLRYFLQYDSSYTFMELNDMSENILKKVSDAYVILSKRYIEADVRGRPILYNPLIAQYAKNPPQSWIKVLSFSGKPEYNSVNLYYAGN